MVAVQNTKLDQNEKGVDSLNFSKNNTGFLHEVELYAPTDISKHLEEFLKEYLNRLQCRNAYWTRLEKLV